MTWIPGQDESMAVKLLDEDGVPIPLWGVHAGALVTATKYEHDPRRLSLTLRSHQTTELREALATIRRHAIANRHGARAPSLLALHDWIARVEGTYPAELAEWLDRRLAGFDA